MKRPSYTDWLTCQITGIADYVCNSAGSPEALRSLELDFLRAAERVDEEIRRREAAERDYQDDGVFG